MPQRTPAKVALGRAVSALRERKGLTQERLALESGLTRKAVSELERGLTYPRLDSLDRIAAAVGVDRRQILGEASELEARARGERPAGDS